MLGGRFNLRGTLLIFALTAMMMRAVVPPGYMPAHGADGTISLSFCNSAEAPLVLDLATGKIKHDRTGDKSHGPCVFAGAPALASVPTQAALAAPYRIVFTDRALSASVHVGAGLAAPPPPSRGPPLLI
ncbi:MAG: hypothetical protein ABUL73_01840 [Alphaproteobacteria bacterium]